MTIVTWNKPLVDGSVKEVHFTRLFSETDNVLEKIKVQISLEQVARRQGVIRSKEKFLAEMDALEIDHEFAISQNLTPDDFMKASEFFATQAMLATVRYGFSESTDMSFKISLDRFKQFVVDLAKRSSKQLYDKAS